MQRMEDREFEGIVTGVTDFGIFVEIVETSCEGLVRMTDLTDDFYDLDKDNYRIIGSRTGRIISFGDILKVKVKDTNLEKRSLDLELVGIRSTRVRDFSGNRSESRRGSRQTGSRLSDGPGARGRRTGERKSSGQRTSEEVRRGSKGKRGKKQ